MRRPLAIAVGLAFAVAAPAVAAPCRTGVEVQTVADASRVYGDAPRPIRIVLWYPAEAAPARPVTAAALAAADWPPAGGPAAPASDLDVSGCAGWRAVPRAGRFPLVLLGSGLGGRGHLHATLAEALADAGFVVAFIGALGPSPGAPPRFDADSVRLLAADWLRAIETLSADARVDAGRMAAVAWSVGSVVHLAVARERPEIRAAVSLDGGVAYDYGPALWAALSKAPPRPIPYLHLAAGVRGPVALDDALLTQLDARVQVVEGLSHAQFLDVPAAAPPGVQRGRDTVRQAVRAFLELHLKAGGAGR
jgi:dienelactone hydrolase